MAAPSNSFSTGKPTWQRDFGSLNRQAVDAGLVTSQEQHKYRKGHDVHCSVKSIAPEREPEDGIAVPPTRVAGITSGEPVVRVLRGSGNTLRSSLFHLERTTKKPVTKSWQTPGLRISETRASQLRTFHLPVGATRVTAPERNELWRIASYEKVAHRSLDTFRSNRSRGEAREYSAMDGVSRKGFLGQGIYEQSISNL